MKHNNENTNAFLIHISALAGYIFPFGSIITPLIVWQTLRDRSQYLDEQGKEAVNFNISYSLYMFLAGIVFIPVFIGTLLKDLRGNYEYDFGFYPNFHDLFGIVSFGSIVGIIGIIKLILVIIAATKTHKGEAYKYPFTIKFIK